MRVVCPSFRHTESKYKTVEIVSAVHYELVDQYEVYSNALIERMDFEIQENLNIFFSTDCALG